MHLRKNIVLINETMKHFTTQKEFFQKLDIEKYREFENNLCWIINIFLVLKELG